MRGSTANGTFLFAVIDSHLFSVDLISRQMNRNPGKSSSAVICPMNKEFIIFEA